MALNIGIEKRKFILTISLLVEDFTSLFLSGLLDIENYQKSKSFGNKSSNLSFSQKINLLIDIGAMEDDDRKKFITFMEIRNQFMHNLDANNYENCFKHLDGKDKFILKLYPQDNGNSNETKLEKATEELAYEILKSSMNLYNKLKEKIEKKVKLEIAEQSLPILIKVLSEKK